MVKNVCGFRGAGAQNHAYLLCDGVGWISSLFHSFLMRRISSTSTDMISLIRNFPESIKPIMISIHHYKFYVILLHSFSLPWSGQWS